MFFCYVWPDRQADAKDVYNLLLGEDMSVRFSEVSLRPGTDMRVAIARGRVTPAMLDKLLTDRSIASKGSSAGSMMTKATANKMMWMSEIEMAELEPSSFSRSRALVRPLTYISRRIGMWFVHTAKDHTSTSLRLSPAESSAPKRSWD